MNPFVKVTTSVSSGQLGALKRGLLLVTRETVSGFTPSPQTGLYTINASDLETFETDNPTSLGLIEAMKKVFGQTYSYPSVFILSAPSGVSSADLNQANSIPRAWSIITIVDQYNGAGDLQNPTDWIADATTISGWGLATNKKVMPLMFSMEDGQSLPAALQLGGALSLDPNIKVVVSDAYDNPVSSTRVYQNIVCAWMSYCINYPIGARNYGSLSDAHDFALCDADTYSNTTRSLIYNNSLGQYNGAPDAAGALFVYDSQMNDKVFPPTTPLIETLLAIYYVNDAVLVAVTNFANAAGQSGIPNDDAGLRLVAGVVRSTLNNLTSQGWILTDENGNPEFSLALLTASQVTALSPLWRNTGVWPAGTLIGKILPFSSAKYVEIDFFA